MRLKNLERFYFEDLEQDSLASLDVKVAAAWLMIHCSANSSAFSGSEIVVERSCTIVAVFNDAIFCWNGFFKRLISMG